MTTTTTDKTVTFTERAMTNMRQMSYRVNAIGNVYGHGSPAHVEAAESLANSLVQMLALGGHVSAEDDLSLIGVAFITYGVIFHRSSNDGSIAGTWSVHS